MEENKITEEIKIEEPKLENNQVLITGMTIGYIAWYKEHYCVVKISPKQMTIIDDQDMIVCEIDNPDVNSAMKQAPKIVASHIGLIHYSQNNNQENNQQ